MKIRFLGILINYKLGYGGRMSADANAILDMSTVNELREMLEEGYDELIDDYLSDTPTLLQGLTGAASTGDMAQLTSLSHTLKGSSGNIGVHNVYLLAQQLEQVGRGQEDGDPERLLQALEQAYKLASQALQEQYRGHA